MTEKKPAKNVISPDAIRPDLSPGASEQRYWYWVGLLPSAPMEGVTIGGVEFPKRTDLLSKPQGRGALSKTVRTPQPGTLLRLSRQQVERVAERIGRVVFRFAGAAAPADGENIGDAPRRQVQTVTIPTEAEREAWQKNRNRPLRPFTPRDTDEAVAGYAFMQLVGGFRPKPKSAHDELPPPVSETGIELPETDAKRAASTGGVDYEHGGVLGRTRPLTEAEEAAR